MRNKDNDRIYQKKYRETHKEKAKEYQKNYREKNKEKAKKYQKKYNKIWRLKNKESLKVYNEIYNLKNKEKIKTRNKNYRRQKRNSDNFYKLKSNIRTLIYSFFKQQFSKKTKTAQILGCTFQEFKEHIEKQFESWMNWSNHGRYDTNRKTWQLDHIIPVSIAKTEEDVIRLNHYTNFKPLESLKNILKSNK